MRIVERYDIAPNHYPIVLSLCHAEYCLFLFRSIRFVALISAYYKISIDLIILWHSE